MADRICSIPECGKPLLCRGWCGGHYTRWRKYGDPFMGGAFRPYGATVEQRFWAKVDKREPDECWAWLDHCDKKGYGYFSVNHKEVRVHRFAYELLVGPIPNGLVIDHTCHNDDPSCPGGPPCRHRRCVNPNHLLPSTNRENLMRSAQWRDNSFMGRWARIA